MSEKPINTQAQIIYRSPLWNNATLKDSREEELILSISNILSDRQPHPAGRIAFKLGVSAKTVRRKLQVMRDELQLPVVATREGFVVQEP